MTISFFTMEGLGPGGTMGSSPWNSSNLSFLACSARMIDLLLLLEFRSFDSSAPSVTSTTTCNTPDTGFHVQPRPGRQGMDYQESERWDLAQSTYTGTRLR